MLSKCLALGQGLWIYKLDLFNDVIGFALILFSGSIDIHILHNMKIILIKVAL